jgi:hypothetical protein
MFPWNYGFHSTPGQWIFIGVFYLVVLAIFATVLVAARRLLRDLRGNRAAAIQWQEEFHDLLSSERVCRHVFTSEFKDRTCDKAFDCRACETHAKLVARNSRGSSAPDESDDLFGLRFPSDRYYHRGHAWVHPEQDGTVTVGLDELGARLVGTPDRVLLPPAGGAVTVNGTAWRMSRGGSEVRVLSPVEGEVIETGGPDDRWYLRVKPAGQAPDLRHLLRGGEVRGWLMRELERLQLLLSREHAGPALADGGVPVDDFQSAYPQADWDSICGQMFLEI